MEDAAQRYTGFAQNGELKQVGRLIGATDVRATLRGRAKTSSRRITRRRAELSGERELVIAEALRRLEREHIALLLALCELEDLPESPAMRQALQLLLREDFSRTQHALALAAAGRYGKCEECARPLPRRTLELKPATTRCSLCASPLD